MLGWWSGDKIIIKGYTRDKLPKTSPPCHFTLALNLSFPPWLTPVTMPCSPCPSVIMFSSPPAISTYPLCNLQLDLYFPYLILPIADDSVPISHFWLQPYVRAPSALPLSGHKSPWSPSHSANPPSHLLQSLSLQAALISLPQARSYY